MGLFDGYFDPEQFGEGGGLLGRLLALQQQHGQYQPGADLDPTPSAAQAPLLQPQPWSNVSGVGRPSYGAQTTAPNPASQYQALRPVLGDHNAMLATINPEVGKALLAQALASRQNLANAGEVLSGGAGQPAASGRVARSGSAGIAIRASSLCALRRRSRANGRSSDPGRRGASGWRQLF